MKNLGTVNFIGNDKERISALKNMNPFERMELFQEAFLKTGGWNLYSSQVRLARKYGILKYEDDLFASRAIKGNSDYIPMEKYIRDNDSGIPTLHPEDPERVEALLRVPSISQDIAPLMKGAYSTSLDLLKSALKTDRPDVYKAGYFGTNFEKELDNSAFEAWQIISPAFDFLNSTEEGQRNSKESVRSRHKDFIQKYVYSKFLKQPDDDIPNPSEVINELYLATHWLVNVPNMPGMKRLIPKRLPFSFASGLSNEDVEYWMGIWGKHSDDFKNYVQKKIKSDEGSVRAYVDVSKTGAGLSYFFIEEGSTVGSEDPSTMISWSEFGEWIKMKYKFAMLVDVHNWFRKVPYDKKDPSLFSMLVHKTGLPKSINPWSKTRYEKLIEIIQDYEDTIESDSSKIRMKRSWVDNIFEDAADRLLNLNQNPKPTDLVSMSWTWDKPSTWLNFRDEWNWILSIGNWQGTEIGEIEREALIDFLKKVDSNTTPEEFDKILNKELGKYFLQEKDWWDSFSEAVSEFGNYSEDVAKEFGIKYGDKATKTPILDEEEVKQAYKKRK